MAFRIAGALLPLGSAGVAGGGPLRAPLRPPRGTARGEVGRRRDNSEGDGVGIGGVPPRGAERFGMASRGQGGGGESGTGGGMRGAARRREGGRVGYGKQLLNDDNPPS